MDLCGRGMRKEINLLELFSGIGGFTKGFQRAGYTIKKHYFSEIDKHAIANYKYNFKDAEYIGSVTDVRGRDIERPDIITFGSPCQDFSLAGKRAGLEGKRSNLVMEAIRLITETKPSVFIWENVKGSFSSNNGADFWAIIAAFANIGGYRLEWQLLNTSWFLPQNRERIYLVGHFAGRSTGNIFPITENDRIFNEPERAEKRRTQAEYSTTLKASGAMKADDTFVQIPKKAGCLTGGGHSGGLHSDMTVIPILTPARKEKRQNGRRFKEDGEPAFTLGCQDQHGVMINNNIRRLTEIECERLQGFPDNWTEYGNYDGEIKKIAKTQRYKMIGNAVTVDIVKIIAERLKIT
jgi:DNA (cytosine-5)-methyltransferase 1